LFLRSVFVSVYVHTLYKQQHLDYSVKSMAELSARCDR